jgi:hypothetical protein
MTVRTKAYLKAKFVRGAKPVQADYTDLIDSYQDTGSSDAFTAIGQALVNASTQASARSAIGIDFVTTAQAVNGAIATGAMNPVLVKNQVLNYGYTTGTFATTAQAVSGLSATTYMSPVLSKNQIESFGYTTGTFATTVAAVSAQASSGYMNPILTRSQIDSRVTQWVAYTPALTGFGTATGIEFYSRRVGDTIEVMGKFTVGTSTGAEARVELGFNGTSGNITSEGATKLSSGVSICGSAAISVATVVTIYTLVERSATYLTFGVQTGATAGLTKALGTAFSSGQTLSIFASVPIASWT